MLKKIYLSGDLPLNAFLGVSFLEIATFTHIRLLKGYLTKGVLLFPARLGTTYPRGPPHALRAFVLEPTWI